MGDRHRDMGDDDGIDIDEMINRRLHSVEKRISERINRREPDDEQLQSASRDDGHTNHGPEVSYRAEIEQGTTPDCVMIRRSEGGLEFEVSTSESPLQGGAIKADIGRDTMSALQLSHNLDDDAPPEEIRNGVSDIGKRLGDVIPEEIFEQLEQIPAGGPLLLRTGPPLLDIPWELTAVPFEGPTFLLDRHPMGRIAAMQGHTPRKHPRLTRDQLSLLVLGDPDQSLGHAGVDQTLDLLENQLEGEYRRKIRYSIYRGPISKSDAVRILQQGGHDVVFFMGHGCRSPKSGFVFYDDGSGGVLTSRELSRILQKTEAPRIWISNACLSARMAPDQDEISPLATMALAMAGQGIRYIGTSWSIWSPTAVAFALGLLTAMLQGQPLGMAMAQARIFCYDTWPQLTGYDMSETLDPFSFVLYGDPSTQIALQ